MKQPTRTISCVITTAILILMFFLTAVVLAEKNGTDFRLDWWTIDGGGGKSTGNAFTLQGTIGQPDASEMSGGAFTLYSGYWRAPGQSPTIPPTHQIYLPYIENTD